MNPYHRKKYVRNSNVIKWIFDDTCYICNKKYDTTEAHHINNDNTCNDLFNLLCVCKDCHNLFKKATITIHNYKERVIEKLLERMEELI